MANAQAVKFNRLPAEIRPNHYDISLTLNLEKFTFTGKQNVQINVIKPTKIVTVNSVDIVVKNVYYSNGKTSKEDCINIKNIKYNASQETVTCSFEKEIPQGKEGYLTFEFDGKINDKLNGLYRSKYLSEGEEKYAAVTQFAPIDARRCFPCWDEPAIKSTFSLNLTIPQELTAISNTPIKKISKVDNESDLMSVSFEKTPVMSTYLVAFMVCDYDFIQQKDNSKIRVYAPKDKVEQGKFSLNVSMKALNFYESYFNVPYPLPKLDLITVADFSFGAMENWGLITYREVRLLVDPVNTSTASKQKAALTVAHELAHQWFGNLVTMEWWTDLWLNEGYASFMEYLCIDNIYPDYDIWAQFLTNVYKNALELDSLANTHPIEVPIENPSEITEIFDLISYYKGASIIRMIYRYIGDDDFKKGMHLYLDRHAYSNVNTVDLWNALAEASNKPIDKIMSTWTKLSGFPLITVNEKQSTDPNKRVFTFSQGRFYINGSLDSSNDTWIAPIMISSAENPKKILKTVLLDKKVQDVEVDVPKESWIKINAGVVGFYRTLYSSDLLESLLKAIQDHKLPTFDRLGLIDDLFATARASESSTVEFLKILKEFKTETNYIVWSSIISNLRQLNNILLDFEDIYNDFKRFGRTLLSDIHTKLGWTAKEDESHLDTLLRNLVLSQLVDFENESVLKEAQRRFDLHVKKQNILPADLRRFVYQAVLLTGNMDMLEKLLSLYRETDMQEEKARILSSLGATKDKNIIQRVLEFSTSDEVRTQDTWSAIHSVTMTSNGRLLAWQYFKSNWKMFVNRFESGTMLKNIVESVIKNIVSEAVMNDVKLFFEKNNVPGIERTVKQSIETIEMNLAWLNRDKEKIKMLLKSL